MLTLGIGLVPMGIPMDAAFRLTDGWFQVFATFIMGAIIYAIGKLFLPKKWMFDNLILLLVVIVGLGSIVIRSNAGRAVGEAVRSGLTSISGGSSLGYTIAILVLLILAVYLWRRKQKDKNRGDVSGGAVVLVVLAALALLLNPGFYAFVASAAHYIEDATIWGLNRGGNSARRI